MQNSNLNDELLDSLAEECGEVIGENEAPVIIDNKDVLNKAVDTTVNKYAYDDGLMPMPGESVTASVTDKPSDRETGVNTLIAQAAMLKLEKEKEDEKKSAAEMAERKKDLIAQLMYQQEEMYFVEHKFRMTGKQKRTLRRIIEKKIDKGEFNHMLADTIPLN